MPVSVQPSTRRVHLAKDLVNTLAKAEVEHVHRGNVRRYVCPVGRLFHEGPEEGRSGSLSKPLHCGGPPQLRGPLVSGKKKILEIISNAFTDLTVLLTK